MPFSLTTDTAGKAAIIRMSGRLDAHGAQEAGPILAELKPAGPVILDLAGVDYLSSAGVRIFVALQKTLNAQGRRLMLASVQPYCRDVLKISGLDQFFALFENCEQALAEIGEGRDEWSRPGGRFVFHRGSHEAGAIEVLGNIEDVLASRITLERMRAKRFSAKEYSLGLGALGPSVDAVMPLLGEMMTIGGTMVWLPTDGNDTPDFLVPHRDSGEVVIRTGFNASLAGKFNEYIEFESSAAEGTSLTELYRSLFDLAKERRPDYRGALALAMRAEIGRVFGCGVVRSPVAANAPANGKWITDPSNYSDWFEADETPRHADVTGLICSIGLDLEADLSVFNPDCLGATFYVNPGNVPGTREKLHSHGVFFSPHPLGEKPWSLEREIQSVVEEGHFIDMRHLFDRTTIQWALIGVVYVQDFRPDAAEEN